ncbi:helix-turn-helix domain-containing protein [Burkholderia arboris]|uniref:helix-turn-helix domain-containing protein n=1 Tax=Burkholderia arboris TaxID=488730 RepID=UPI001CF194CE|nr:helix-turn-helix transcriptional regulator [Burkholderia arboris]MCA8492536.1 helix-turn-helix transcriptional regulator [Burkholderia arboris]
MKMTQFSSHAFVTFTSSSDYVSASSVTSESSTSLVEVSSLNGLSANGASLQGGTSIDDLIAEQDDETLSLMRQARQELSESLRAVQPVNIRTLRLNKGWTQRELAERVDMSQPQIARLEKYIGDPCLSSIKRIAVALGVGADEIVSGWPGMSKMAEIA